MSQKLDNLKQDFESKFDSELKQDILKLFLHGQKFLSSAQRFLEENKSTLVEIKNEMCYENNCNYKLFNDYITHLFMDDKDIESAINQFWNSIEQFGAASRNFENSLDVDNSYYVLQNAEFSIF